MMKNKQSEIVALEAELVKLTKLLRQRREQLARLKECPHTDCQCRAVWKDQVEKTLAGQVRKIRREIASKPEQAPKSKSVRSIAPA